jgi:hypothetical protein
MGERRNAILIGEPKGRPRCKLEIILKLILKRDRLEKYGVDWCGPG